MSPRRWAVTLIWVCTCAILQLHCVTAEDKCVFPFQYGGKLYFDCIPEYSVTKWCSLTEVYDNKWKYCTEDDRAKCVFPFVYKGKIFSHCINWASKYDLFWCSLTPDYDQDKAWKYCDAWGTFMAGGGMQESHSLAMKAKIHMQAT
ncbi:seminal plasma protein HSP-1-like [Ochotona princeps]|uniref:seminal plasma protein HSP-1-like n=1 Tax=Ochotona princeps TaxID=9978 RepID=UPI0027149A53|nr:seminal plasma protein HSP-1-like [Ochotona princeps]